MLEHPHIFTLGRGADERFIVDNPAGVPVGASRAADR